MNYDEAMKYLEQASASGIRPGLDRMMRLMESLGRPDRGCKIIHVAGTNGKGSVCTYISSILRAAGYSVGRYISPSVYGYWERIQINGIWIKKEEVAELVTGIRNAIDSMCNQDDTPSVFEIETAMAFMYFANKGCDYVVLETGMGGSLDATNVIEKPVLTVITPISMDHMSFLGDSIRDIAAQKGGIIKRGCLVVSGSGDMEAEAVIRKISLIREADYTAFHKEEIIRNEADLLKGQCFDYKDKTGLRTMMSGKYQVENAALAIEAVLKLPGIDDEDIRTGIRMASWPGRFELISKEPVIIVDGAHNPAGVKSLEESLSLYFGAKYREKQIILVMGVFADKDYVRMLDIAAGFSQKIVTFRPDHPRGLDEAKLTEAALKAGFAEAIKVKAQALAIKKAMEMADKDDVIVVFGSLSTVAVTVNIVKDMQ